jgi:hypothetical protein
MVNGEASNPPSPTDSPPRVETVSPGEELEEGLKEVLKLDFPDETKSGVEPEDLDEFEDTIYPGHPPNRGCRHVAFQRELLSLPDDGQVWRQGSTLWLLSF